MRICPECGSTKVQEDGEIVCTGCGLVLKARDVVLDRLKDNFNFTNREWESQERHPIQRYDRWVSAQKDLSQKLEIPHSSDTTRFLQTKRCEICGKQSKKKAKLSLCEEHTKEYRKYYKMMNERERRAKKRLKL